jgi:hypothetical protein
MYSCACSLSSNPIDLSTVITCECSQDSGRTALLWASYGGHAMLGWSRAILPWSSPHTLMPTHTSPTSYHPSLYVYITYIHTERQSGSGACGIQWQTGGHADWSGHGGGAGRERLPRLGHLCVDVCVWVRGCCYRCM